jgi:hypothetical protein
MWCRDEASKPPDGVSDPKLCVGDYGALGQEDVARLERHRRLRRRGDAFAAHWLNGKFESIDGKFESIDLRFDALAKKVDKIG